MDASRDGHLADADEVWKVRYERRGRSIHQEAVDPAHSGQEPMSFGANID